MYSLLFVVSLISICWCDPGDNGPPLSDCTPSDQVWTIDKASPFYTQFICGGLYAYGDGAYNSMFLVTDDGVIIVDAPSPMAGVTHEIVKTITNNPITTVIYSHHHADHIGATSNYPNIENAEIVCFERTNEVIAQRPDLNIPQCTKTFKQNHNGFRVKDGGKEVRLFYTGFPAHTDNDIFIFAGRQRTIMGVDIVFPGWVPFRSLAIATDPAGYRESHNVVLGLTSSQYGDWLNYIGGHADRIGTRDDVILNLEYFDDLVTSVATSEETVTFPGFMAVNFEDGFTGDNTWSIYDGFQKAQAAECARIMIEDLGWDEKFKDAESMMASNCLAVSTDLRVNEA